MFVSFEKRPSGSRWSGRSVHILGFSGVRGMPHERFPLEIFSGGVWIDDGKRICLSGVFLWDSPRGPTYDPGRILMTAYFLLVSVSFASTPNAEPQAATDEELIRTALDTAADFLLKDRPRAALEALEPVELLECGNPWLWFCRGLAHDELGNVHTALACFDRARDILLALGDPDPKLSAEIRRQRRQTHRRVLNFSAQIGLAYDTNVTFRGGGAAAFDLIAGRDDGKFASYFQFDYAPIANERDTVAVGARLGHSWHFSVEDFNHQDYGGYIRWTRRLDDRWQIGFQYDYDWSFLGNESFLSNHGLTLNLTHVWPKRSTRFELDSTSMYYRFEARDFLLPTSPEFDRDGVVHSVGLEQGFRFQPLPGRSWIWKLHAGYRFSSIVTEGTEFDRTTHDFFVGLGIPLKNPLWPDKPLDFQFNVQWEIADYRNDSLIDRRGRERADFITGYGFVLSQTLVEDLRGGLVLHAIVNWTDAHSNVTTREGTDPFTYDKVLYGLQLEWSW